MLDTWFATRYEAVLKSGRTKPLVLNCHRKTEDSTLPESKRFVVKCMGLPEVTERSLFCEAIGNLLARELGVNTPAPALIDLGGTFVDVANLMLARDGLRIQEGLGVGCEYVQGGFTGPIVGTPLAPEEVPQATLLYGFDLLVQNPDRTPDRTNCFFRGHELLAFDFETAFSFLLLIGQQYSPWEVSKHGLGSRHLFQRPLRRSQVDWKPLLEAVHSLDVSKLREWARALPESWCSDMDKVVEHMKALKRNQSKLEVELQRSLT